MSIRLQILGVPVPKQSARFTKKGIKYIPKKIKDAEKNIRWQVLTQLPRGFVLWTGPIRVTRLLFVFPPVTGLSAAQKREIDAGGHVFKHTKPDLTDNLPKSLYDAMEGIVYKNDSQICAEDGKVKLYGLVPRIEIELEELHDPGKIFRDDGNG